MNLGAMLFLMLLGSDAPGLQRQNREDTIYVLRGELKTFHQKVGEEWTGGTVIDDDSSDGTLTYWAYSDRTAAESRAIMLPAIFGGLQMTFAEYQEAKEFPLERRKLDEVALGCGATIDPFFVSPKRSIEISMPDNADAKLRTCLLDGVRLQTQLPISVARKRLEKN